MDTVETLRRPLILPPEHGRVYDMGRIKAVFKADGEETAGRSSVSEWWLEPRTRGPGAHSHGDDHIYYVIEGVLSVSIDGRWSQVAAGGYALIPGGTPHDFANRGEARTGFISLNTPGGFEEKMAGIAQALAAEDLRLRGGSLAG